MSYKQYKKYQRSLIYEGIEDANKLNYSQRTILTSLYIDGMVFPHDQADMFNCNIVEAITKAMRMEITPTQLNDILINQIVDYYRDRVDEDYEQAVTDFIQEERPWECASDEELYG